MAHTTRDIVVVGASAGGVHALQRLVAGLPAGFPGAILIVLHMWPGGRSYLAAILGRSGPLPALDAEHGMPIERGKVYVAPPDRHLVVEGDRLALVRGPRENRCRPAINPLFRSAARFLGGRVIGVILTGTLDDGAAGLWAVKQAGGVSVVQSDPEFAQMPQTALENVDIDYHLPLEQIPVLLNRLVRQPMAQPAAGPVPEVIRRADEGTKMKSLDQNLDEIGRRSPFSCPECNGPLWEVDEGILQFRCHVGHVYSPESFKHAQGGVVEEALWTALRALKESAALDQRLAERAGEQQLAQAAARYRESAVRKAEHAARLQEFLKTMTPDVPTTAVESSAGGEAGNGDARVK